MDEAAAAASARGGVLAGRYTCRKNTRALYRARQNVLSRATNSSLNGPDLRSSRAPLKTHARPTLLKRMRYRFYSLTLHNFVRSSPLHISPVVHTFTGNYARCNARTRARRRRMNKLFTPDNVSVHKGQREMQTL